MFFDESLKVRLRKEEKEKIFLLLKRYPDRWDNASHFVRSAILHFFKYLEEEKKFEESDKDEETRRP